MARNLRSRLPPVAVAAALSLGGVASAESAGAIEDDRAPAAAMARLFGDGPPDRDLFADAFLSDVSPAQVGAIVAGLLADFGPLLDGRKGAVRLERASVPVTVVLKVAGRIEGLWFGPPEVKGVLPGELAGRIAEAAEGEAAVLAVAARSAFKLFVLRAYEDAVRDGRLARDRVVRLGESDRSLPSGVLQTLAPGTPVTVELLAALMIQHSDNTAADALMRVLGREAVERVSPRNVPFPTTAELFKLKAERASDRREAYARGTAAERRAILAALADEPPPRPEQTAAGATWREAEWFATARELCGLLLSLRETPAMNGTPTPLLADEGWRWIGFKGGSEFGVLNLSAAGVAPDGREVCAVATANGRTAQPEAELASPFAALFRSLRDDR